MRNENDPFNRSGLSKRTLYEFLRANSDSAASTAHPIHRTPWINKPRSTVPMSFPSTGKPETSAKTALERLAATTGAEVNRAIQVSRIPPPRKEEAINLNSPVKPPPMFGGNTKKRALVVNHIKGSTPERIRKLRIAGDTDKSVSATKSSTCRILTLDDLHKSVLGIDFNSLESSLDTPAPVERRINFFSLDEYKEHQSKILLVETMEGLRQSLSGGFVPASQAQSSINQTGMYSTVNVRVTTAVRKGREFCLLTLKRATDESDQSQSFLSQGDVVLLFKPDSPFLETVSKYGFLTPELSPRGLTSTPEQQVLYGIIERSKPSLVMGRETKSVQLRCPLASKDAPLGYSPSDVGTIGSEFVAVIIHSLLTVEREWAALCALKSTDWFVNDLLARDNDSVVKRSREITATIPSKLLDKLNQSQREAVAHAANRDERLFTLLIGPPGTGKSHTLVSLLECYEYQGMKKILVAAPSNAAIDELMLRFIKATGGRSRVVRIGRHSAVAELKAYCLDQRVVESQQKTEESRYEIYRQRKDKLYSDIAAMNAEINNLGDNGGGGRKAELIRMKERVKAQLDSLKSKEEFHVRVERDSIYKKFLSDAQFIFGTLSSFGSEVIVNNLVGEVDVCVVDEAAQAIEVSSLIPFRFRPKKIVLVGDPQQLPAVVKSTAARRAGFDMSLMERLELTGRYKTHMLTEQYRMDSTIAKFPSGWFYEGKLATADSVLARKSSPVSTLLGSPFSVIDVEGAGDMKQGTSLINPREARVAVDLVRYVITKLGVVSIGVISPYRQQVNMIRSLLSRELEIHRPQLEVDSVDAFQGREKDVIIFSCVRAGGSSESSVGFLADERRLNVAITRARRAVWMIGNTGFLKKYGGPVWQSLISHCNESCSSISSEQLESFLHKSRS
jgi:predicted DNA helicase